uniref:F-box domain-containing protein n=1 Tax=Aegilops tauschii TaxID=37682 RepID=M8B6G2_AEGTA
MVEELVEKILLSIPLEEPEILVRASLACTPWCRLLSGNPFRSRYLALHGTAPVLGFLQSWVDGGPEHFIPTKNFFPAVPFPNGKALSCSTDARATFFLGARNSVMKLSSGIPCPGGGPTCESLTTSAQPRCSAPWTAATMQPATRARFPWLVSRTRDVWMMTNILSCGRLCTHHTPRSGLLRPVFT